ncbi:YbaB/EbfC family nucleoid-associated protein [Nonomuraea rhizosphaerae]|uniref:YbaB/EbfC family nucleoid-associated protein n=1 Tax=Nonomuraea rhizosphaerae TaxID=2665663 RepID=UPI001C5FD935|nr:YbaB/EbfC family nucleoid-associated protein [Nonomuraea rhizosphaerae]
MFGPKYDPGNITDRDLDEATRQSERMLAWIETAQEDLGKVVGTGKGPSGHVGASVDSTGRVLEVTYGSRAMRLPSEDLAEETVTAVREANADAQRQIHDLMREGIPGYDPVEATAELERVLGFDQD